MSDSITSFLENKKTQEVYNGETSKSTCVKNKKTITIDKINREIDRFCYIFKFLVLINVNSII